MKINLRNYWKVDSGDVSKISMENNNGVVISHSQQVLHFRKEFLVPTETGALKNIVLGFSNYEDYYKNNLCACQSISRVAGRIRKASYTHNMVLIAFLRMRKLFTWRSKRNAGSKLKLCHKPEWWICWDKFIRRLYSV